MKVKAKTTCKIKLTSEQRGILYDIIDDVLRNKDNGLCGKEVWFLRKLMDTICGNKVTIKVTYPTKKKEYDETWGEL